jgi:hypothetical protein
MTLDQEPGLTESGPSPDESHESERDVAPAWAEGDAALHLEELLSAAIVLPQQSNEDGLSIEIVGPHLRVSGTVQLGYHRRLSDFINNHQGLIDLREATVLRRNGEPTRVNAPNIWINPADVTLIGSVAESRPPGAESSILIDKDPHSIIAVTPGHTLTGEVYLAPGAILAAFIESSDPLFIPMTEVRTRSLADRRVITRYSFALLNRRHMVAATALQPGMMVGRRVL